MFEDRACDRGKGIGHVGGEPCEGRSVDRRQLRTSTVTGFVERKPNLREYDSWNVKVACPCGFFWNLPKPLMLQSWAKRQRRRRQAWITSKRGANVHNNTHPPSAELHSNELAQALPQSHQARLVELGGVQRRDVLGVPARGTASTTQVM